MNEMWSKNEIVVSSSSENTLAHVVQAPLLVMCEGAWIPFWRRMRVRVGPSSHDNF